MTNVLQPRITVWCISKLLMVSRWKFGCGYLLVVWLMNNWTLVFLFSRIVMYTESSLTSATLWCTLSPLLHGLLSIHHIIPFFFFDKTYYSFLFNYVVSFKVQRNLHNLEAQNVADPRFNKSKWFKECLSVRCIVLAFHFL